MKKAKFTKEEFLKRCETAWECGYVNEDILKLMNLWAEMIMRLEGGQLGTFSVFLETERHRTNAFTHCLASDEEGYKVIELTSLLSHPCQKCATDKSAWHTRSGFCTHKEKK